MVKVEGHSGTELRYFKDGEVLKVTYAIDLTVPGDDRGAVAFCAYWDVNTSSWITETAAAVRMLDGGKTVASCAFAHLTSFAVVMDVGGPDESSAIAKSHQEALSTIS